MRIDALRRERLEFARLVKCRAAGEQDFAHFMTKLCESLAIPMIRKLSVHGVADRFVIGIDQHAARMHVSVAAHDRRVVAKEAAAIFLGE